MIYINSIFSYRLFFVKVKVKVDLGQSSGQGYYEDSMKLEDFYVCEEFGFMLPDPLVIISKLLSKTTS